MIQFISKRPLDATKLPHGAETEPLKVNQTVDVIFAGLYNTFDSSYSKMPGHTKGKGFIKTIAITIHQDGSITESGVSDVYFIHGILLWVAWGILGLLQLASNRYLKHYWKASMWIHRISGIIIWGTTVAMAMWVIVEDNWKIKKGLHPALGLGILIAVSLPALGGILSRRTSDHSRWNTASFLKVKLGHKLFGYLILFVSQVALLLGCLSYSEGNGGPLAKTIGIIGFIIVLGLVAIFELLH